MFNRIQGNICDVTAALLLSCPSVYYAHLWKSNFTGELNLYDSVNSKTFTIEVEIIMLYRTLTFIFCLLVMMSNDSLCEIFTNPFQLKAAFIMEHRLIKNITSVGISRGTPLGKAIYE